MTIIKKCPACYRDNAKTSYQNRQMIYKLCQYCGLEWKRRIPSQHQLNRIYNDEYFFQETDCGLEKGYADYEMFSDMYIRYFTNMIKKISRFKSENEILIDIGCGPGIFLDIAKKCGYQVIGVDVSTEVVNMVKKKYNVRVIKGEFPQVKINNDNVGVITAFQTIEHVRNPLILLQSIYRTIKPGGLVVMTTLNLDSVWRKIMGRKWFSYLHDEHLHYWNPKSLKTIFKRAGFSKIQIFSDVFRTYTLDQIIINMRVYGKWPIPKLNNLTIKQITKLIKIPFPVGSIGIMARKPK